MVNAEGSKNLWGEPNDRPMAISGSCIERTMYSTIAGGVAGTFMGSVQLAWYPDNASLKGTTSLRVVSKTLARPSIWMAVTAATFTGVDCLAESFRGKNSWNAAVAGFAAGAVMGSMTKRADIMFTAGLGVAVLMGTLDLSGTSPVYNPEELFHKQYDTLPAAHVESDALRQLKEKYPKFKNL